MPNKIINLKLSLTTRMPRHYIVRAKLTPQAKICSLNSSIIVLLTVISLNMPSNFDVN